MRGGVWGIGSGVWGFDSVSFAALLGAGNFEPAGSRAESLHGHGGRPFRGAAGGGVWGGRVTLAGGEGRRAHGRARYRTSRRPGMRRMRMAVRRSRGSEGEGISGV